MAKSRKKIKAPLFHNQYSGDEHGFCLANKLQILFNQGYDVILCCKMVTTCDRDFWELFFESLFVTFHTECMKIAGYENMMNPSRLRERLTMTGLSDDNLTIFREIIISYDTSVDTDPEPADAILYR